MSSVELSKSSLPYGSFNGKNTKHDNADGTFSSNSSSQGAGNSRSISYVNGNNNVTTLSYVGLGEDVGDSQPGRVQRVVNSVKNVPSNVKSFASGKVSSLGHRIANIVRPEANIDNEHYSSDVAHLNRKIAKEGEVRVRINSFGMEQQVKLKKGQVFYVNSKGQIVDKAQAEKITRAENHLKKSPKSYGAEKVAGATYSKEDILETLGLERNDEGKLVDPTLPDDDELEDMSNLKYTYHVAKTLAKGVAYGVANVVRPAWNLVANIDKAAIGISQLPFTALDAVLRTDTVNSLPANLVTLFVSGVAIITKPFLVAAVLGVEVVVGLALVTGFVAYKALSGIFNYIVAPLWNHTVGALINKASAAIYNRSEGNLINDHIATLDALVLKLNKVINTSEVQNDDDLKEQLEAEKLKAGDLIRELEERAMALGQKVYHRDGVLLVAPNSRQSGKDVLVQAQYTNMEIANVLSLLTGRSLDIETNTNDEGHRTLTAVARLEKRMPTTEAKITKLKEMNELIENWIKDSESNINDQKAAIKSANKNKTLIKEEKKEIIDSCNKIINQEKKRINNYKKQIKLNNQEIKNLEKEREEIRRRAIDNHHNVMKTLQGKGGIAYLPPAEKGATKGVVNNNSNIKPSDNENREDNNFEYNFNSYDGYSNLYSSFSKTKDNNNSSHSSSNNPSNNTNSNLNSNNNYNPFQNNNNSSFNPNNDPMYAINSQQMMDNMNYMNNMNNKLYDKPQTVNMYTDYNYNYNNNNNNNNYHDKGYTNNDNFFNDNYYGNNNANNDETI